MSTLYRDYRPQNFLEILGQNHIKITLQNEISAAKIAQAYLFCGPRAVGKTTLARVLAKAVNCQRRQEGEFEPCNECANCRSITAGKNLDVVEIDAASNTGVDNVRDNIIAFSRLMPAGNKYKVFIIDEVHMLSLSAFNALLKIIEEPPAYVIFILCTTEVHKVPLTIISRCERFDFKRISVSEIVKKLTYIANTEKITIDKEVLEAVARRSGGHLRDAESLLGQIFSLGDKKITLEQAELVIPHYNIHEAVDLLEFLSRKDAAKAVGLVNSLADSGVNVKNFTAEVINLLRKIMLNKLSPSLVENLGLDLGENLEMRLSQVAGSLDWEQIFILTRRFLEVYNDNKNPLIAQLPLEIAIAEFCFTAAPKINRAHGSTAEPNLPVTPNVKRNVTTNRASNAAETSVLNSVVSGAPAGDLNLEEIMEKWPEFLVKIKKYNHSLSFVLQNCRPQSLKDGQICLVFKYKFHQDRIKDVVIKNIVEKTLAEVFGGVLAVVSGLDENLEIKREEKAAEPAEAAASASSPVAPSASSAGAAEKNKESAGLLNSLLKTFGGEIIN